MIAASQYPPPSTQILEQLAVNEKFPRACRGGDAVNAPSDLEAGRHSSRSLRIAYVARRECGYTASLVAMQEILSKFSDH